MDWYYSEKGQQKGPVTESELRGLIQNGTVAGSDLIWRDGMSDWVSVSSSQEFAGSVPASAAASPVAAAPVAAAPVAAAPVAAAPVAAAQGNPYAAPAAAPAAAAGPYSSQPQTSGLAIASLVCGLCGLLCGLAAIAGVITGHIALSKIAKSNGTIGGKGMAIAGTILGYVCFLINLIVGIAAVADM